MLAKCVSQLAGNEKWVPPCIACQNGKLRCGYSPDLLAILQENPGRTAMYKRLLDENVGNGYILEVDSHPHCIAWWDTARDNDMPDYAELICIHSLQDNWRKGFGTQMMSRIMGDMRAAGYDKVMLWVFTNNIRARKFYESFGFFTHGKVKPCLETEEICYERKL